MQRPVADSMSALPADGVKFTRVRGLNKPFNPSKKLRNHSSHAKPLSSKGSADLEDMIKHASRPSWIADLAQGHRSLNQIATLENVVKCSSAGMFCWQRVVGRVFITTYEDKSGAFIVGFNADITE